MTAFPQTTRRDRVEGETKQKKLLPLRGFCFESVGSLIHRKVQSERLLSGGFPRKASEFHSEILLERLCLPALLSYVTGAVFYRLATKTALSAIVDFKIQFKGVIFLYNTGEKKYI